MKNVLNFPPQPAPAVEHIDEALFEKNNDAALLLKCFEVVKDTLDVIAEPEYSIEDGDDTHIDLYRAFYALKVLFRRRTGDIAHHCIDHPGRNAVTKVDALTDRGHRLKAGGP